MQQWDDLRTAVMYPVGLGKDIRIAEFPLCLQQRLGSARMDVHVAISALDRIAKISMLQEKETENRSWSSVLCKNVLNPRPFLVIGVISQTESDGTITVTPDKIKDPAITARLFVEGPILAAT